DDDDRARPRGERLLDRDAHQRLAADLGQQLVRPAHTGRAAGGEHDRGEAAAGRHLALARLRAGDDLPLEAADPPAADIRAAPPPYASATRPPPGHPAQELRQPPAKPLLIRVAPAAGRAEPGVPRRGRDQHEIAGIDRHAEMLDLAADRLDRRRDDVALVG